LFFPSAGVINPFELTIALAENAVQNGVSLSLDTMVESMVVEDGVIKSVSTNRGTIKPKLVINAAGVFCENIAALAGDRFYSIHPRKSTIAVIDRKYAGKLINTALTPIGKTPKKKAHVSGCSVIRSISGNILVGPDSLETISKEDYSTSPFNIKEIFASQSRIVPGLDEEHVIAYFSGISAATYEEDFVVSKGKLVSNIIHAAGIQIPGLTAAPAISMEVAQFAVDFFGGEGSVRENPDFNPVRSAPPKPLEMSDSERSDLIEANPDYGIIICRCEEISKGEILEALRRNVKCNTLDGVKRRVRAGMGRCHGSLCAPQVIDIIAAERRLPPHNIRKSGSGSEKVFGNSKTLLQKKASSAQRITERDFKADMETTALLHKKALELQAAKEQNRKESVDDDYE
jgi:glycerol-3-phosphate dehydrogenase